MVQNRNSVFLILLVILSISCKKQADPELPEEGKLYFPLDIGKYVIYNVAEINIDAPVSRFDTTRYQLKQINQSVFIDNTGQPCIRVERYWRTADTLPWVIKDVWYHYLGEQNAQTVEENQRYIRLVFPMTETSVWNGNAYNQIGQWNYLYENINQPLTLNNQSLSQTVLVRQRDYANFIEKQDCFEIYAKEIGLVKKQYVDIEIINGDSTQVNRGYMLFQNLISYGVE